MRLYYFTSAQYGLEAIRDQRIKVSTVDDLNDPFEWLSVTGNRSFRATMRKLRKELGAQYGIICMSDNWKHPLLWAHYAENHKGMCLGFEVSEQARPTKVDYIRDRVDWLDARHQPYDEGLRKILGLFNTKFDAWEYESEYRMLVELRDADPVSGLHFEPLSDQLSLMQVIVGERCTVTRKQLDRVLGHSFKDLERFKVRAAFRTFEMVQNLRQSTWK